MKRRDMFNFIEKNENVLFKFKTMMLVKKIVFTDIKEDSIKNNQQ